MRSSCLAKLDCEDKYLRNWTWKSLCKSVKHDCVFAATIRTGCPKCKWVRFYTRQYFRLKRASAKRACKVKALNRIESTISQLKRSASYILDSLKGLLELAQSPCDVINFKEFGFVNINQLDSMISLVHEIQNYLLNFYDKVKDWVCFCIQPNCCWLRLQTTVEEARDALFRLQALLEESLVEDSHLFQLNKAFSYLADVRQTAFFCGYTNLEYTSL